MIYQAENCNFVFGLAEPKPISNAPANSRVKLRLRGHRFAMAIVYDTEARRARWAAIHDRGDAWELDFDVYPAGLREGILYFCRETVNECAPKP